MRCTFLCFLLSLISANLYSQTLNNTLLGFQEPTTKIAAIQSDESGHIYYFGLFKGALVRNNQVVLNGSGGNDLFIIKTDTAGNLLWARNYGGEGDESVLSSGIPFRYSNGTLCFTSLITYPTQMGAFTIEPYGLDRPASCIVRVDTANGNVLWARKTSLIVTNLQSNNSLVMLSGNVTSTRGAWLYEQQTLQDSTGISRLGIMYMDSNGNLLGRKQIYQNIIGTTNVQFGSPTLTNTGQIIFSLTTNTNNTGQPFGLYFQDSMVTIPNQRRFQAICRVDTAFKDIRYRLLNESNSTLIFPGGLSAGMHMNTTRDSLYYLLQTSSAISYSLDGFNVPLQNRSTLVVMDSNLVTARVQTICQGSYYQQVTSHAGYLYFLGAVVGANQAPSLVPIPPNEQTLDLFNGLTQIHNLNGPSRSMIVRATADLAQKTILWLGDATAYDGQTLSAPSIIPVGNQLYFTNANDETWNLWIIDTSLVVKKGAMIGGRDRAEISRLIRFFNDGSKFILGEASGKTAYDTSAAGIVNSSNRTDLIMARLGSGNNLIWYKRIFTSFRRASQVKTVLKNNKAYVLMTLNSPANATGFNYFKFDSTVINVTANPLNLMLVINADGTSRVMQLNNVAAGRMIVSFDVYDNGDLAAVTNNSNLAATFNGVNFPTQTGYFILRLDSMANVLQALKYQSSITTYSPSALDILIHPDNNQLSVISTINFQTGMSARTLELTDKQSYQDAFTVHNPKLTLGRSYLDIMRIRVQGGRRSDLLGPIGSSAYFSAPYTLSGNKLYIPINKSGIRDTLFHNTLMIDADTTNNTFFLLGIDTSGKVLASQKFLPPTAGSISFSYNISKLSSYGNSIYASGSLYGATLIDTIQVGYRGGVDGLTIEFDTLLNAKRVFRLQSIYQESINDCAIYNDSVISFAYTAQSVPNLINGRRHNRTTKVNVRAASLRPEDMEEDAYVGDIVLNNIVTASYEPTVSQPKVYPNPVLNKMFLLEPGKEMTGRCNWVLYDLQGRIMDQGQFANNGNAVLINIGEAITNGVYFLGIYSQNDKRRKTIKLAVQ